MNKFFLIFLTLLPAFAQGKTEYFSPEGGPSFPCSQAKTPAEKAICGSEGLSNRIKDFDNLLTGLYKLALEHAKNPGVIKSDQKKWLAKRQSNDCTVLLRGIDKRIRQLLKDKGLVRHLCNVVFSPEARLSKEMLLGRDPSYVFCREIPILDTPDLFLNQLLIAYLIQALVPPMKIDTPTALGSTECYRVNDHLYFVAFSSSTGAHDSTYKLFLVQLKDGIYDIKHLDVPYFDRDSKQIKTNNDYFGNIGYNSKNRKVEAEVGHWKFGYTACDYEIKNNKLVLIQVRESYVHDSEEHQKALAQGEKEDDYGRIWVVTYSLTQKNEKGKNPIKLN